ncbi:ubiquinone biosynthesis O-methyltransferase, mitochondrial-like isoform X3 [Amphibalanus amphitrite]|uniref:ubiquinone biosynthesis O-methyltransferase, mitochondrial-like isoform X3 n=1 Tax=Amphibalanus amphitrite TaxID=1232801 RepID=UPI001C925962|nr:ubiquinone biosynthesis O-methyltransferase, mitochondrial-like isoform X3 [Amphibalanus amphitrite]
MSSVFNSFRCPTKSGSMLNVSKLCAAFSEQVGISVSRLKPVHKRRIHVQTASFSGYAGAGESTVNPDEVAKFSRLAALWWDETGEVRPLHAMNELRVPLVRDGLVGTGAVPPPLRRSARPLAGLRVADVGCGGGLLSEPLARLGAHVTGIDAAEENIQVAALHATEDRRLRSPGLRPPQYLCCTVEELAQEQPRAFDAVVASEVLEHVDNQPLFLDMCCQLLRPGGSLFLTTLNRSQCSWLAAILAAEYVLRILPVGTHDWNKFIPPAELHSLLAANGMSLRLQHGMRYNPVSSRWSWTSDCSVSYAMHLVAPEDPLDPPEDPLQDTEDPPPASGESPRGAAAA